MKRLMMVFALIAHSSLYAATVYSIGSGNWGDPAIWSSGAVPFISDDVIIHGGNVVTVDRRYECWSLQVGDATAPPNGGIVIISDHSASLFVDTDVTLGIVSQGGGVLSMTDGEFSIGGTLTKSNGGLITTGGTVRYIDNQPQSILGGTYFNLYLDGSVKTPDGPLTIEGDLSIFSSAASFNAGPFTHHVKGNLIAIGTISPGTGTIVLDGSSQQTIEWPTTFHDLVLSGPSTKRAFANITVEGNLTIDAGATLNAGPFTHKVKGDWTNNGTFNAGVGTIVLNGVSIQHISNASGSFNDLTLKGAGTKQISADLVVDGSFTLDSGTTYQANPGCDTHLRGQVTVDGTLDLGNTTLWLEGTGPQDIPGDQTYGHLRLDGSTKTATGALTITGPFNLGPDATFNPGSYTHHLKANVNNDGTIHAGSGFIIFDGTGPQFINGSGSTTFNDVGFLNSQKTATTSFTANGELYIDASASFDAGDNTLTVGGDWNTGGTFIPGTSTVLLNGTSPQSIIGGPTFKKLTLSGAGMKTANASITVESTFVINAAATFSSGSVSHYINGDWNKSGTFLANAGTIVFGGTHPQTITGSYRFFNVTVENDSGVRLTSAPGDSIQNSLMFTSGRISLGSSDLTLEPSATVTGAAAGKCIVTNGTGRLKRTIQGGASAGTFTFPIAPNKTSYNPLAIGLRPDPSEPTETFSVRVEPLTSSSIGFATIDSSFCTWRVWTIDEETVGGNHTNIAFQWNYDEDGTNIGIDPASPVQAMAYLFVNLTGHYEQVDDAVGPPYLNNPIVAATLGYTTTSFGSYIVGNAVALPIQLSSFTGVAVPNVGVRLDWQTVSELNNYGFYVQRKGGTDSSWVELPNSFTSGNGTTNQPHEYSFVDSTATRGVWQYRLHQVDFDGTSHYLEAITVSVVTGVQGEHTPAEFALKQNYPNPFNPATTISFEIPTQSHVTLSVFDMTGREITTLVNATRTAGRYAARFDANDLASGVYFYQLTTPSYSIVKRMVFIR